MKTIGIIAIFMALTAAITSADEISVGIDRMAVLDPGQEDSSNFARRVAIHFTLPTQLDSMAADIVYAELHNPFDFTGMIIEEDATLELQAYDITTAWIDGEADWQSPWSEAGGDLDTSSFYTYTINCSNAPDVFLDLTKYVKGVVEAGAENFGLMLIPNMHELRVYNLPRNLIGQIATSAQLKVVYH